MTTELKAPPVPRSQMYNGNIMAMEWQNFFRQLFERVGGYEALSATEITNRLNLFVEVVDIEDPIELSTLSAVVDGRLLVAYSGNKITVYSFTPDAVTENKPYVVNGSTGSWLAVAGEYVYAGYTFSDVKGMTPGRIPYAGEDGKLDESADLSWDNTEKVLSAKNLLTDQIDFNLAPTITPAEGRLSWNPTDGTLDLGLSADGIVTQQIGQELFVKAVNKTGSTITEGSVVYCDGRQGIRPKIALAKSDTEATSMVLGVVTQDIPDNEEGFVTTFGYVRKIKTDYATWAEGDTLWVSKTTAGVLTNVEPSAPHHSDVVGSVGVVHENQGSVLVLVQRHKTLEELSDVNGTPLTLTGQFPSWNSTSGFFDFIRGMLLYYTGGAGYIKVDTDVGSDLHIVTGTGKTIVYDTALTEDLNFDPARSGGPVATRPDDVTINNVFHKEFTSANNQLCGAVQEIPHNYKLNTNLHPHCHVFLKSGESAGTTGVTFTLYWELRQSTGTTSGSVTLSATSAQLGTTAGANKLDIYNGSFAGSAELGAQLAITIARTAGNAGDVVLTTYGVHYEKDTPGSRTATSK